VNSSKKPVTRIGVFDSGVGGLTVLRELLRREPGAEYLYFGDTARLPYGSKSAATVAKYAISAARFLQDQGAEHLVIACNTASALALDAIADAVRVPVLGVIEPGAEEAARSSKSGKVIVIATEGTVGSHAYREALQARGIIALEKACPLFVPLVEEGWTDHPVCEQVAHIYLDDLFTQHFEEADVLVLGCTHYPLLKPLLRRVVPEQVAIVDSAEATARMVQSRLPQPAYKPDAVSAPRFFASDSVEKFRLSGEKFLGTSIGAVEHVDLES